MHRADAYTTPMHTPYRSVAPRNLPRWSADGRCTPCMQVCVHRPDESADETFLEWYDRRTENDEWKRREGAPKLPKKATPMLRLGYKRASTSTSVVLSAAAERGGGGGGEEGGVWAAAPGDGGEGQGAVAGAVTWDESIVALGGGQPITFRCAPLSLVVPALPASSRGAPKAALGVGQCKRNPLCTRGYKHTGHCLLVPAAQRSVTATVTAAEAEERGKSAPRAGRQPFELPPGWTRVKHVTVNGNTRIVFSDGRRKANTVQSAWLTYMSDAEASGMQAPAADWPRTVPAAAKRPKLTAISTAISTSTSTATPTSTYTATYGSTPDYGAVVGDLASVALGMAEVREMLERFRLGTYAANFDEAGYDDRDFILQMNAEHLDTLVRDVGMKPGHALKFRDFLAQERRRAPQVMPQSR